MADSEAEWTVSTLELCDSGAEWAVSTLELCDSGAEWTDSSVEMGGLRRGSSETRAVGRKN
ncbi:hypothetical protein SCE1572_22405 [Sorangium cellulosum So0157-2]|uniref:Uncharacterized protein n=1 Tax=Sorangium cellulosum So0157-2 TaxID=1254432 RepID=S4XUY0_SORCE|nr:hypothetical protein SCE1572_22405 [Sorangium cellulosum So0157-2]